jgi:hypothetical protein
MKHRFVSELARRRLVGSFAVLIVVLAAGAQVLSRTPTVTTKPPVPVITVYLGGDLRQSSLTVATLIGTLDGIARTPSPSPGGTSPSPGGTFEMAAPPTVAEVWLRRDAEWLDKNMLLWMNRHPVLLKQP